MDVDALEVSYYGYKYAEGEEHYDNAILSIQFKHKWIDKPFWINIFKGAQARTRDAFVVAASWDKVISYDRCSIGSNGALYENECIIPEELEDGSESLAEMITAFHDHFFEDDDCLMSEDAGILSYIADRVHHAKFFSVDFKMNAEAPTFDNIMFLRDKTYEAESIYRHYYGKALLQEILAYDDLPETLRVIIEGNDTDVVLYETVVDNGEWGHVFTLNPYEVSEHMFTMVSSESFNDETDAVCDEDDFMEKYDTDEVDAALCLGYLRDVYSEKFSNIILGTDHS